MATPLSEPAVDMLDALGVDALKVASGDLTWDQLVRRCALTGRPLVLSTGMASMPEVAHAVAVARIGGASALALLHCVSAYPVPAGSENLRAIESLARAFSVPVGLSDHGADAFALPMAVAMGASLYERHIMLAAADGSVDASVSSDPDAFAAVVGAAGRAAAALGTGEKCCSPAEAPNRRASRRALYAVRSLAVGHLVTSADVVALRPEVGLPAGRLSDLIGARLARSLDAGAPFLESDLQPAERVSPVTYVS
jgi:N-acetylneuraminate synthase